MSDITVLQEDVFLIETALTMCNFQYYSGTELIERSEKETLFYRLWLRANYNRLREPLKQHKLYENVPVDMNRDESEGCEEKCELCNSGMFFFKLYIYNS